MPSPKSSHLLPLSQQTIGPFFPASFFREGDNDLTRIRAADSATEQGEKILLRGRVSCLDDVPVENAIVEAWQADAMGRFRHPHDPNWRSSDPDFLGWGRAWTDENGYCEFRTVLPGGYISEGVRRSPHVNLTVWAAGLMRCAQTTFFFPEFESENLADPVFAIVPEDLRSRLVLRLDTAHDLQLAAYLFDIRLRGERSVETPFFGV